MCSLISWRVRADPGAAVARCGEPRSAATSRSTSCRHRWSDRRSRRSGPAGCRSSGSARATGSGSSRRTSARCALPRRSDGRGQTLQATALVHEAYLRLIGADKEVQWQRRGHFFAAAAEAMRRILVEKARHKQRAKHGGSLKRHDAAEMEIAVPELREDLVALDDALTKLQ